MKRALSILLAALLLLVAVPAVAEEEGLQAGLYVSDTGVASMYLYEEGVGVLNCLMDDGLLYANGVIWTEDSLEIERETTPYAVTDDLLSFTYGGAALALRYQGEADGFMLGELQGTAFAGEYEAEDGRKLALTANGRGVYTDAAGEQPVFWGSFRPFYDGSVNDCFILYGSYLGGMTFEDGQVLLDTETEGKVTLAPAAAPEVPQVVDADVTTVISPAYDLCLTLPGAGWTVEETEAGLLISRNAGLIQYTFLSLALEKAPDAATLDAYADHIWTDGLMGAGVAYDAADTVREDRAVGEAAGRAAATEWTRDEIPFLGDSVLWYANGRLYAALCVSDEGNRAQALELLDAALLTFRTAEEASPVNQLPLDKAAFETIPDLPPVQVEVTEDQVYYGYRMTTDGQTIDLIPFLSAMGMDPRSISLVLRADGTGHIQIMDEAESADITWTEEVFTAEGESVPYIREGDHIILTVGEENLEFAPAAEVEALLAETAEPEKKAEDVAPTAEALVGSWTFTKARAMGMEIPASMMGTEMSLVLSEDGTAILLADGSPTELAWEIGEDGKVSLTAIGTEVFALTFDGTVLVLDTGTDAVEMIFEKDA